MQQPRTNEPQQVSRQDTLIFLAPLFTAFFCSGFAALLNQVTWERMLRLFSGSDSVSVTIVVSAFLAGLGIGNWIGGVLADRVDRKMALLLFAGANALVGSYALLSKPIFYGFIFETLHLATTSVIVELVVSFTALLVPTLAMGATLPLLARGAVNDIGTAARRVGLLYAVDVLGAATGCLLGTWYIIGTFGLHAATYIAAGLSFFAAALALIPASSMPSSTSAPRNTSARMQTQSLPVKWCALYFASGFLAIGLEVIWVRIISVHFLGMAYTFGHVLFIYLIANGAGLLAASRVVRRIRNHETAFYFSQFAATAWAVLSLLIVLAWLRVDLAAADPVPSGLLARFAKFFVFDSFDEFFTTPRYFLVQMVGLPLFLIGPSAFLIGFSFPIVQQAVQRDLAHVGRGVGLLLTANIAGNALGGIVTGLVLLPWIGTPSTLRIFIVLACGFCIAGILIGRTKTGRRTFAAGVPIALLAALAVPGIADFWMLLTGFASPQWQNVVVREDRMSVTTYLDQGTLVEVAHGGKMEARFPFYPVHMNLGAIGSLYHPEPKSILNVGFGSGGTPFSAGMRSTTDSVLVFEIIPSVYQAFDDLIAVEPERFAPLSAMLHGKDARYDIRTGDGRAFLASSDQRFDIIQADAIRANNSGSGFLYSKEYFELVRSRLKPGGLLVQWLGGERVLPTVQSVFPYGIVLGNVARGEGIIVASNESIEMDRARIRGILNNPDVVAYMGQLPNADLDALYLLATSEPVARWTSSAYDQEINTDLFPRDEMFLNQ